MKNNLIILLLFCLPFVSISQEKDIIETEVNITSNSVILSGTLLTSKSLVKQPLVIIIPGSGPTDRDGNNVMMKNNSLKYLAENLSEKNIAAYRFDKSVLSYSKEDLKNIDSLTFDVFIDEAKSVINYFKQTEDYSKIIVAGHSQGSLVGMVASKENVDGFISIAGAGKSIDEILVEQIEKQAPFLKADTEKIVQELKKGNMVAEVNPNLVSLFNKQIQPFLISWIKYNPQSELKKLTIPVLIINGTKDIQVSVEQAQFLHEAKENSQLNLIENMNHLFKEIKGDTNENILSYSNPNLPIMEELINIITTFVDEIK